MLSFAAPINQLNYPSALTALPGSNDLLQVLVDAHGAPLPLPTAGAEVRPQSYAVFNRESDDFWKHWPTELRPGTNSTHGPHLRWYTLGELVRRMPALGRPHVLRLNPQAIKTVNGETEFLGEEILVVPHRDGLTQKWMTTAPEYARALLALGNDDLERYGIQVVFHALSAQDLPNSLEEKSEWFERRLRELSFVTRRVPVPQGAASILCVVLNLEDPILEKAFIRSYPTLDPWTLPIFLTSQLELLDGELDAISYNGAHVDGILRPLVQWYQTKVRSRS